MWQRAYDAGRDRGHGRGKCILQVRGVHPFFSDKFGLWSCPTSTPRRRTYAAWGHRLLYRAVFLCGGDHSLTAFCPLTGQPQTRQKGFYMAFFNSAVDVLQTLVVALGAGLGIWGVINLMEGYGNDNPGANAHIR